MAQTPLRIIPLGGLGEIGKNMMALEFDDDIIVIDAGVLFPDEEMLGVDLVIPDITYLEQNKGKVRGILITHGHEDHTGALPYILPRLEVPVYAPRLAHGLISVKLKELRLRDSLLNVVEPGKPIKLGRFRADFFRVCHSIPDSMGIAIHTPLGMVVHTGDFKIDHTPVDSHRTDLTRLAQLGSEGVLLLFSDSTYADREGYTASERVVGHALDRAIGEAKGRVLVATFASLISRIQQVIDAAAKHGRKVAVVGRSMVENVKIAANLNYLTPPPGTLIGLKEALELPHNKVVIVTTGSQGEPTSALVRMANQDHRDIQIVPGDTVIISASPIPGNETVVSRTIDNLYRLGAQVLYHPVTLVHVHGHASQEELKMVLNLVRPRFFVPVHGQYRHLVAHGRLAEMVGMARSNIFIMEDGDVLELTRSSGKLAGRVPAGPIYVDGLRTWDPDSLVLRDRRLLSRDGIVVVIVAVDQTTGDVLRTPEVVSSGFVEEEDHVELFQKVKETVLESLDHDGMPHPEWQYVNTKVRETVGELLYRETGRRPMIIPVVLEV